MSGEIKQLELFERPNSRKRSRREYSRCLKRSASGGLRTCELGGEAGTGAVFNAIETAMNAAAA